MPNRPTLILPTHYSVDIIIKFDPYNGQTELQVRNRSKKDISFLQIAGILTEHAAVAVRNALTGNLELQKIPSEPPTDGGTPNAS